MNRPYVRTDLSLSAQNATDPDVVRALQIDLRALGYLSGGIDGKFGVGTQKAVRALQYDLLHNRGIGSDGNAPVDMTTFNKDEDGSPRVTAITGTLDQSLARALAALIDDPRIGRIAKSANPASDNRAVVQSLRNTPNSVVPIPFLLAITKQESGWQHFRVPATGDLDSFVTIGQDRNADTTSHLPQDPDHISSRGYGIGQYTLFHHPPAPAEVSEICEPQKNVSKAIAELRDKFDRYVAGPHDTADDRIAEHGHAPLRICRYAPDDVRYLRDCTACAAAGPRVSIAAGTPFYAGATGTYQTTPYYQSCDYSNIPDRKAFACDWPYAVRRYNGGGVNSYHYQCRILRNLLTMTP